MRIKVLVSIFLVLAVSGIFCVHVFSTSDSFDENPNYEAIAEVSRVIDGDTLEVKILKVTDPHEGVKPGQDKIRLAGINTEETSQSEAAKRHEEVKDMTQSEYTQTIYYTRAKQAKKLLQSLIPQGTKIYLDINDLADGRGPYRGYYGRIIGVVFVKKNGEWINGNAKVLNYDYSSNQDSGYSPLMDKFNSEFNPYDWLEKDYPYA